MEGKGMTPRKEAIVKDIIQLEWSMFDRVQNIGGRASCQEDWRTFYIMRYSQHSAYSMEMLESYHRDLLQAEKEGRNLISEKYAYMMEVSDPEYYRTNLKPYIPEISREKQSLIAVILEKMMEDHRRFAEKYPAFSRAGRPAMENAGGVVSVKIYTMGELKTYSQQTLQFCLRDILQAELEGNNLISTIQATTAGFYGYKNLEEAEAAMNR